MARRAIAYIDGFNLYYGAVKGDPPLKWLDVQAMCEAVLRNHDVAAVRYYTARVTDRSDDPGQSQRQDVYLRALATRPKVEIVCGQFKERPRRVPLARPRRGRVRLADVIVTEEKGSDVNLATDLLWDALAGAMDVALVVSNDLDLQRPIARVMSHGVTVLTVNPHRHQGQKPSLVGTESRNLRLWHLRLQMPDVITAADGSTIRRPKEWS
jgi:NYN domain